MAGEWWRGSCNGARGYFPKSHVAIIGEGVLDSQRSNVFHSEKPPLARAMFDFVGASESELTFKEGDVIGQVNSEPAGNKDSPWWQGTRGGRTGFFPREYVVLVDQKRRKVPYTAKVVYKFDARDPKSQLSLATGEFIEVLELCDEVTGGWWVGRKADNKVGYFPANYAKFAERTCERCQKSKAKARVTLPGRATACWYCKQCVLDMAPEVGGPPPKAKPAATPAVAVPPAAAATAAAPKPAAAASPPAAPAATTVLPPGANDAASARLAALGMAGKGAGAAKAPASPVITRPPPAAAVAAAPVAQPTRAAPVAQQPPPQQQPAAAAKLPAAVSPAAAKLPPPPALANSYNEDDSDDEDDDSDTDDVSSDDEQGGSGLTYVEMLRQEYRKHLPAPEDMRADFGKAPAPPRPNM
jgi:hypothetical protein